MQTPPPPLTLAEQATIVVPVSHALGLRVPIVCLEKVKFDGDPMPVGSLAIVPLLSWWQVPVYLWRRSELRRVAARTAGALGREARVYAFSRRKWIDAQ